MILVACKLPNGLILDPPGIPPVTLNGKNTAYLPGAPGLTNVDESVWALLLATYGDHPAFVSQAIFATGTDKVADIQAMAQELVGEKTGFEGIDPNKPGAGIKIDESTQAATEKLMQQNAAVPAPAKSVEGADAAAAAQLAAGTPKRRGK